jgi:hypothetical protein
MKMWYQDVGQENVAIDGKYVAQPLFHEGWSSWRCKNKILNVQWILPNLWNAIFLLSVEKPINHLF